MHNPHSLHVAFIYLCWALNSSKISVPVLIFQEFKSFTVTDWNAPNRIILESLLSQAVQNSYAATPKPNLEFIVPGNISAHFLLLVHDR